MSDYIDQVFGPTGLFAQSFPGYAPRDGQIKFARAVDEAFRSNTLLMCEAPTGVGKTHANLVPAIKNLNERGGKLVYVTAGIALQEQVITKDLPSLQKILPWKFTFEIAKGFSNFACQDRMEDAETDLLMKRARKNVMPAWERQEMDQLELVLAHKWLKGDVSELPFEMLPGVRRLTTIASEDCLGKKCGHFDSCYPRAARKSYESADIIVTNYHLYAIDLVLKSMGSKGILPPHRLLVGDEIHDGAGIFREYFGVKMTLGTIRTLTQELDAKGRRAEKLGLPTIDPELKRTIATEAESFFAQLERLKRDKKLYQARLNRPDMIDGKDLQMYLHQAATAYELAASGPVEPEAQNFLRMLAEGCMKRVGLIQQCREIARTDWICFIDGEPGQKLELAMEPISAAQYLKKSLWEPKEPAGLPRGIVLCSATLATGTGEDAFEFSASRLGVNIGTEMIVDSPFDFSRAALIVPKELPEPNEPPFAGEVAKVLCETVRAAGGRTLGLFTSYRVLDIAYRTLKSQAFPYTILRQGDAPRTELIKRFREDETSVLLGTDSFWQGVDVQGESCVALVIDRIPFEHFENPLLDAIKSQDKNWFKSHYLPEALLAFKQGVGRLIRSVNDYGVIVCCDVRIIRKGYGRAFRKSVPKRMRFSDDLRDVPKFLEAFRSSKKVA